MNPKHSIRYPIVLTSLAVLALLAAALFLLPGGVQAQDAGICGGTPEVRDWILARLNATDCATVTTTQLNGMSDTVMKPGDPEDMLNNAIEIKGYSNPTLLRSDFEGLTSIRVVVIIDSPLLRAVPADAFDGFNEGSLLDVYLNDNGIKAIAPGAFSGMSAVILLGLQHNDIVELPGGVFSGLISMNELDLTGNRLTALPSGLFGGLTMIDNLDLSGNSLTTLPADIFAGLDPGTIDLEDNKIATLPADVFDPVNPTFLHLGNNELTTLDEDIFDGLTDLRFLSLNGNGLTTLPTDLFDPLDNSLNGLSLAGNSITTLHEDIFDGLTGLYTLLMHDNSLTTLPADLFDGLTGLTTLHLQENSITTLPEDVFDGLSNVFDLRLSGNELTALETELFDPLDDSLLVLRLQGNSITALHEDIFDGLTGLEGLHLQDNSIASLHVDIFDGLGGIEDLRLSKNAISTLTAGVFTDLDDSLTILFLQDIGGSGTDLTTLPANIFDGLTGLQDLDLSCNALTALDLTATSPFNPFATTLYYLDIRGNSFTTQPTHADLVAKLTHDFLVLHDTGTTPCKSARETGLSALTVSSGTLDPAFTAPGAELYYVDVAEAVSSLTVTATREDPGATVGPSGTTVDADTNTAGIQADLVYGLNVIQFEVRSRDEDGTAYSEIWATRAYPDSPVAVLRELTLSDVPLEFNGNTTDYTVIVAHDLATTTVVATPLDPDAATPVIKINDMVDADGEDVSITQRSDTITVEVTAEDGTGMETYTITLNDDNTPPTIDSGLAAVPVQENTTNATVIAAYTASDVDTGDTLTWSLTGDDAGKFDFTKNPNNDSYQLKFKAAPNFESPTDTGMNNVYNVTVNVYDGSVTTTRDVAITVSNADDPGTVTITGTPEGGSELTASLTDPDGNPTSVTWQWARRASLTASFSNITGATSATYTLVAEDVGKYLQATASYTDDHGAGKTAGRESRQVAASNNEPAFAADTTTRSVAERTRTVINVGAVVTARDADSGDTLTYSLSGADSGSFSIVSTSGQIQTRTGVIYDFEAAKNSYTVIVNVRDSKDAAGDADTAIDDSITVTINLTNLNEAPVIPPTTAATTTFAENGTGTVVDFEATDVDAGTTLTWSVVTGDDGSKFSIDSAGLLTFTNAPNFEAPTDTGDTAMNNTYVVTVRVTDNGSPRMNDTHRITVTVTNVNEAPVITSPPTTANFPENETRTVATFAATDQDTASAQNTLTWTVEPADDGGKFSITKNTDGDGELTFSSAPDFETPTDTGDTAMNNSYVVTVKVVDNGTPQGSDTHGITVTVTNVNEAPTIDAGSAAFSVDENTATATLIQTYEASDVDASTTLTWSLEGEDAGDFTFTKNADGDGELKFRSVPDFEMPADDDDADMVDPDNDYQVTVKVTDNGSPRMNATQDVTVTVNDVNERPVVSGDATHSFMEIEFDVDDDDLHDPDFEIGSYTAYDDDGDGVTWSVSGSDAVRFHMESTTGVLSFSSRPDFEMPADRGSNNEYNIFVNADDGQGEDNSVGSFTVTVTVTNVDETPEITGGPNAPDFAEIEYDAHTSGASVVVQLGTYTARDEEGEAITWTLGGDDAADFSIVTSEGHLLFRMRPNFEMPADADMDNVYEIIVKATDATPNANTREYPVTITVTDVNERPDISGDAAFSYVEVPYDNTAALPALRAYTAEDYDAGDTFTWSLAGPDMAHMEIDPMSGVLTFRQGDGPLPDYENPLDETGDGSSNTYNVIVNATDNHGKAASFPVLVTVTNVNERPELTTPVAATVTYDENTTIDVATYTARDEEGGVTWRLTGTDSSDFAIDRDSGAVTFTATPDWEIPVDSGTDNVYEFTVIATDVQSGSSRLTATVDVTVTVADVEEAGAITLDTPDLADGDTVIFTLSDPDGDIDLDSFQWFREKRTPGGSWGNTTNIETGEITYPYETDEDDVGLEIRVRVANYTDRRGSGKSATGEGTNAVTADPIVNAAPRFIGSTDRRVEEGETGNVGDRVAVSDRDGDTLTFGLGTGGNSDLFTINTSTGQLSIAEPLDYETAPNAPVRFYTVTVTLHDGEDENGVDEDPPVIDVQTIVSVLVLDVEEPGVVTLPGGEPEIGVRLQATLEDPDGGVTGAEWQWARSADGETGWTNIAGATSSSYTPGDADASVYLRATVTYEDRRGPGKEASALTGDLVPGENRRPTFPDTEDGLRAIAENTRANRNVGAPVAATDPERDRLTYSLTGTDAGAFTIVTSSGQLRTKDALDFETQSSYSVAVEVHDGRDGAGAASTTVDDTQSVIITIENLDEPGTVTLTTDTATISARVPVTAQLSDPDNVDAVDWQWYGSPNGSTGWVAIQGAVSATYTPSDDDEGRYIRATASYTDGHGPNKTTHGVSPRRVDEPPPVNSAPAFPSTEDGQREAPEDAIVGTAIGAPVAATDLNAGDSAVNDPLAYSLSGRDAASFTIDTNSGQLRLAQGVTLDYEGKRSYRFTVQVTDGRDQNGDDDNDVIDARRNVTVTVTNVNEAPVVTGNATPSFDENGSSAVAAYTARDPERDRVTWSVSGADFIITDRGRLHFASPPSYEGGETYRVTVTATDDDDVPLAGSLDVTVTVTDLEEEGVVAIAPPRGWENTRFTVVLTDDDGGQRDITWQWERSANRSRWMEITGATSSFYTAGADDVNSYLRATASYTDSRGSNKTAEAMPAKPIVALADKPATNAAPEFASDTLALSVVEGATAGRNIRSVTATDAERDVLTYSLAGTDAGAFDIDAATGQLRTKAFIDREIGATYTLTVSVHDGFDAAYNPSITSDDTIEVTITVTAPPPPPRPITPVPVTEPVTDPGTGTTTTGGGGGGGGGGGTVSGQAPTFTASATRSIAGGSPPGANVGLRVAARNPSNASLTYSLGGPDVASFTIVPTTGQIRVAAGTNLDYQSGRTTYTVQVTARSVFGSVTTTVTIKVTSAALGRLGSKYDANRNELIDRSEVIAAVNDYFLDSISREEVTGIIILYFSSLAPAAGEQTGNEGNAS